MNKKLILSTLAILVAYFLGGFLIFGLLLKGFYAEHSTKGFIALTIDPPNMISLILGNLCSAFLIAWILQRTNSTTIMKAVMTSVVLNLLVALGYDLTLTSMLSLYTDNTTVILMDAVCYAVMGVLTGLAGGAVLAKSA